MTKLVSILIPAYNAEKWVSAAINSAVAQSWPRKEVIIVDDGSTDNTLEIARRHESVSVKVITQENMGGCAARNRAFESSQGDYIQWLDADDILAKDKIALQMERAGEDASPRVLFSSPFAPFFYNPGKAVFISSPLCKDLTPLEYFLIKFNNNAYIHTSSWLASRDLTADAGPWDERLARDQDGEYFCRVVAASEGVLFVPDAKIFYRQSNIGSISRNYSEKSCESLLLSVNLCIDHLRSLRDDDETRNASLQFLQDSFIHFYPEKRELVKKAQDIARQLGGNLLPPKLSWKYAAIKTLFGWKLAKYSSRCVTKSKLFIMKNIDRLLMSRRADECGIS